MATLFENLYSKDIREVKQVSWDEIPLLGTLIQSIYGVTKLIFGKRETKEFESITEAKKWADENNISINIRFECASKCIVGNTIPNHNG
jgi:hypothetical protein